MLSTPPAFILSQDQTLQFELGFSVFRTRARLRNPARWNLVVVADSPPSEDGREPPKLTLVFLFYLVFKEPAARRFVPVGPEVVHLGSTRESGPQIVAGASGPRQTWDLDGPGSGPAPKSSRRCGSPDHSETPGKPNRVLSMKLESDLSDLSSAPARDLWSGRTSESSLVARRCQGQRGAAIRLDRLNELSNALGGSGSGSAETATG